MMSYFADKEDAVYLDCRIIDASTPKAFAYALIEQLLPKIPLNTAQLVFALLPELAWKLATGTTFVGRMGATTSEDVAINLYGLSKLMEESNGIKTELGLNDVFKALRCATCSIEYCIG